LRLAWLAGAASLLHLVIVGVNSTWQGGHCYGPRYTVDFLPWLALLLTIGVGAWLDRAKALPPGTSLLPRRLQAAGLAALVLFSVAMHSRGVFSYDVWMWCVRPKNTSSNPDRVWDWKFPQFMAGLMPWPDAPDEKVKPTPWPK
jgi:hypothetical protein